MGLVLGFGIILIISGLVILSAYYYGNFLVGNEQESVMVGIGLFIFGVIITIVGKSPSGSQTEYICRNCDFKTLDSDTMIIHKSTHNNHSHSNTMDILKERYARGEISKVEFDDKKRDLI